MGSNVKLAFFFCVCVCLIWMHLRSSWITFNKKNKHDITQRQWSKVDDSPDALGRPLWILYEFKAKQAHPFCSFHLITLNSVAEMQSVCRDSELLRLLYKCINIKSLALMSGS